MSGQTQIGRLRALYPDKVLPRESLDGWWQELAGERMIARYASGYRLTDAGRARVERSRW